MPETQIELSYESADEIPEAFRPLYDEQDGKFVLGGVNGMKTQQDVSNVQEALRKERNDKSELDKAVKEWRRLGESPDEIQAKLDRIEELEKLADGKLDDEKIKEIAESRVKQATSPLQRNLETVTQERDTYKSEVDALKQQIERRDMHDVITTVATEMKVQPTALPDIKIIAERYFERREDGSFITKSDVTDVTPGVDVKQFFKEMQKTRPHWFPPSEGGGARGGGAMGSSADNPWSPKGWNLTEQGRIIREQGMDVANNMAKAAGSSVGATKPRSDK